ncbi:hypothetical protein Tco_0741856 [Tanacetum coccineum]
MEDPDQAFVEYASSRIDEVRDPQYSNHGHGSINAITIHPKQPNKIENDESEEKEHGKEGILEDTNTMVHNDEKGGTSQLELKGEVLPTLAYEIEHQGKLVLCTVKRCKRYCEASLPVEGVLVTSGFKLSSRIIMPKSIHVDHHDTAHYIPMYHRTQNVTEREREIYKSLEHRLFHEGCIIDPSYLGDQPNLRPAFTDIDFDCLLDINEIFFPIFEFARILRIPCRRVCVFTFEWAISSLPNGIDSNPDIYPPPHEDPLLIRDALFYPRPPGTPIEVEPLNETKLEEVGLNCNNNTPLSSREVSSFDGPKPQPLLNSPSLDVSLGDVIGPEPPIKPHSPDSSKMKVVDYLTTQTPPSPYVANSHPKGVYSYYNPCIDEPKRHYGFKPGLLGKSVSLGVDISNWEKFDDDWGLEFKEVSPLGEELSLFDRPNEVERGKILEAQRLESILQQQISQRMAPSHHNGVYHYYHPYLNSSVGEPSPLSVK